MGLKIQENWPTTTARSLPFPLPIESFSAEVMIEIKRQAQSNVTSSLPLPIWKSSRPMILMELRRYA
jgi:hypothetical protein